MADVEEAEEAAPAAEAEENEETAEAEKEPAAELLQEPEEVDEEDAVDEAEVDPFEMLDEESEDNEQQEQMYREYLDLTKQIDCQNQIIKDLKETSNELREKRCQTRRDKVEYKRLRICLDQENIKLHTMMHRAIQLQNNGSKRLYGNIELETTGYEDNIFEMASSCKVSKVQCPTSSKRPLTAQEICDALDDSDSDSDSDDICCR